MRTRHQIANKDTPSQECYWLATRQGTLDTKVAMLCLVLKGDSETGRGRLDPCIIQPSSTRFLVLSWPSGLLENMLSAQFPETRAGLTQAIKNTSVIAAINIRNWRHNKENSSLSNTLSTHQTNRNWVIQSSTP